MHKVHLVLGNYLKAHILELIWIEIFPGLNSSKYLMGKAFVFIRMNLYAAVDCSALSSTYLLLG